MMASLLIEVSKDELSNKQELTFAEPEVKAAHRRRTVDNDGSPTGGKITSSRKSTTSGPDDKDRSRSVSDVGGRLVERDGSQSLEQARRCRRPSVFFRRMSHIAASDCIPASGKIRYENTYRLGPEQYKFNVSQVERIATEVLESYLNGEQYDFERCRHMVKQLSDMIRSRMVMLKWERYRIVCLVSIVQSASQGYQVSSRCLWDSETDRCASVTYRNSTLVATALVFGIYYE